MVQGREEVDPLDRCAFRVVVVPGNDVVLIGVGLLRDGVVHDDAPIFLFDGSHMRLDEMPQVSRGKLLLRQEALDAVMADAPTQQRTQTCASGLAEGANQVVGVQIKQCFVRHAFSLPCSSLAA